MGEPDFIPDVVILFHLLNDLRARLETYREGGGNPWELVNRGQLLNRTAESLGLCEAGRGPFRQDGPGQVAFLPPPSGGDTSGLQDAVSLRVWNPGDGGQVIERGQEEAAGKVIELLEAWLGRAREKCFGAHLASVGPLDAAGVTQRLVDALKQRVKMMCSAWETHRAGGGMALRPKLMHNDMGRIALIGELDIPHEAFQAAQREMGEARLLTLTDLEEAFQKLKLQLQAGMSARQFVATKSDLDRRLRCLEDAVALRDASAATAAKAWGQISKESPAPLRSARQQWASEALDDIDKLLPIDFVGREMRKMKGWGDTLSAQERETEAARKDWEDAKRLRDNPDRLKGLASLLQQLGMEDLACYVELKCKNLAEYNRVPDGLCMNDLVPIGVELRERLLAARDELAGIEKETAAPAGGDRDDREPGGVAEGQRAALGKLQEELESLVNTGFRVTAAGRERGLPVPPMSITPESMGEGVKDALKALGGTGYPVPRHWLDTQLVRDYDSKEEGRGRDVSGAESLLKEVKAAIWVAENSPAPVAGQDLPTANLTRAVEELKADVEGLKSRPRFLDLQGFEPLSSEELVILRGGDPKDKSANRDARRTFADCSTGGKGSHGAKLHDPPKVQAAMVARGERPLWGDLLAHRIKNAPKLKGSHRGWATDLATNWQPQDGELARKFAGYDRRRDRDEIRARVLMHVGEIAAAGTVEDKATLLDNAVSRASYEWSQTVLPTLGEVEIDGLGQRKAPGLTPSEEAEKAERVKAAQSLVHEICGPCRKKDKDPETGVCKKPCKKLRKATPNPDSI